MQLDKILYETFSREIGRQFFKNCLCLLALGNIVIIPCFCVIDNSSFLNPQFNDLMRKSPMSFQKYLKTQLYSHQDLDSYYSSLP